MLPLSLLPPRLLLLPFLPPLVPREKPLFPRRVLFLLRRVYEHAGVHGAMLRPAAEGGQVSLGLRARCEL